MKITYSSDHSAHNYGSVIAADGRSFPLRTDWDCPGVAQAFGWGLQQVQRCSQCGGIGTVMPDGHAYCCETWTEECQHECTDGTVVCPDCATKAGEFIEAALDWLNDHDGATADDPGFFTEAPK